MFFSRAQEEYFSDDFVVWDRNDDDRDLDELERSLPFFLGGSIKSVSFQWFMLIRPPRTNFRRSNPLRLSAPV